MGITMSDETKKLEQIKTILKDFNDKLNEDVIDNKFLFFTKFVYYLENENDLDPFFDNLYRPNDEKTEFVIKKSKNPTLSSFLSFSNLFSNNNEKKFSLNTNKEENNLHQLLLFLILFKIYLIIRKLNEYYLENNITSFKSDDNADIDDKYTDLLNKLSETTKKSFF